MDRILKAARASGSLNLSSRSLNEVPDEVYKSLDAVGEGENWWEAVELQKLILAHNNIETLKEDLRNLPQLTVLNVSRNKLSHLPAAIGELQMLKSLDVSFNLIHDLPEELGSAASLVKLDCSSNQIKSLPCTLGNCLNLSELKASNNSITSLPEDLANCLKLMKLDVEGNKLSMLSENMVGSWTRLTELNAAKNCLSNVPKNIGDLTHLIRLDLHQNRISSIPSSIMGCSSLTELYMGSFLFSLLQNIFSYSGLCSFKMFKSSASNSSIYRNNSLSSLPSEIGELCQLGTFDLHSNQLKEYPVEACKLHLSVLDLSNNSLSGLPSEIGLMTTLRKLLLAGNPLRTLRSSLVSGPMPALLKYLRSRLQTDEESGPSSAKTEDVVAMAARLSVTSKELSLGGLSLNAIPAKVWESSGITKVDLSRNLIEELPIELSSCVSLEVLILSRNKIKVWPIAVLKTLSNLICLKLDNNLLGQIPSDGFQAISKLQTLDLSANAGALPESAAFSRLPQLQELYLRRMRMSEVPSDLSSLQQLRILDLSQNALQSVPEGFKRLSFLTELDLSDNNISTLPPELGLLEPNLQVLRLDGNPLRSIRRPILARGTKAVLQYLKDKIVDN